MIQAGANAYETVRNRGVKAIFFAWITIFIFVSTANLPTPGLEYERVEYDDMVVADFIDTYDNLPFKTRSIYHFAEKFCSAEFKFFYFHDSDTILNENIESLAGLENVDFIFM